MCFKQKGFHRQSDGVDSTLLSVLVAHLASTGVIVSSMQPHQAVKAALQFLASHDLNTGGGSSAAIVFGKSGTEAQKLAAKFITVADCVVLDASASLNVGARVSSHACAELRAWSRRCLDVLAGTPSVRKSVTPEDIRAVFLDPCPPSVVYDKVLTSGLPVSPVIGVGLPTQASLRDQNSLCDLPWQDILCRRVASVSSKALGDRITTVRTLLAYPGEVTGVWNANEHTTWAVDDDLPSAQAVWICVHLNEASWMRGVDRGPSAQQRDAAHEFRAFWGEVAELRRFPDGAIAEAVGTCGGNESNTLTFHGC
jgi:U3 small nucleolar RNA-associated protein 22